MEKNPKKSAPKTGDHAGGRDVDIADLDFAAAEVVIVEAPDGRRAVLKGQDVVDQATAEPAPTTAAARDTRSGPATARVMTVRCETWDEVAALLDRASGNQ